MTQSQTTVVIEHITIPPNRFGRLHPRIFAETPEDYNSNLDIELSSIDDVIKRDYRKGDVVELNYIGTIPQLGKILQPTKITFPTESSLDHELRIVRSGRCTSCYNPLTCRNGNLYCDNTTCSYKNIDRLVYACGHRILDLPVGKLDLAYWYSDQCSDIVAPVTQLLTAERDILNQLAKDEDELNYILDTFVTRHNQLHGYTYPDEVQLITQGRFLNALSLRGLYQSNINHLQTGLAYANWQWKDLPTVLTDSKKLQSLGIPQKDAREIVQSTLLGIDEVASFANL